MMNTQTFLNQLKDHENKEILFEYEQDCCSKKLFVNALVANESTVVVKLQKVKEDGCCSACCCTPCCCNTTAKENASTANCC